MAHPRWPLLALVLLSLPPAASCGAVGLPRLAVDAERLLIARQLGLPLADPRFDYDFPVGYYAAAIAPGHTTRAEVRVLVRGARSRYDCGGRDTFYFFSERIGGLLDTGQALEVAYDPDGRVRETQHYDDSLSPDVGRCRPF